MRSSIRAFGATGVLAILLAGCGQGQPAETETEVALEAPAPAPAARNPDAGEGAKAKQEEGKVGKREAKVEKAKGNKIEAKGLEIDRQVAESVGVLGVIGGGVGGGGVGGGAGGGYGVEIGGLGASGSGARQQQLLLPSSEAYSDHGVNAFVDPAKDRVSTFSVDVDTGSYTISRRKLREGALPPAAAVRVEEFVNYFDYTYSAPKDDALFRVHTELAPHPFVSSHHVLKVGLKGEELPTAGRPPLHLTFLVDTSGSMTSADKLALAQRALHYLVDNLGEEDTVALATYAGATAKVLGPTPTTPAQHIHHAIDSLSSGGGTAMQDGMKLAYDMAREAYLPGAENRVIVLSDGDANLGGSSHTDILQTISRHAGQGITLSTVGFGMGNYKDALMEQLADKGDGNYAYIDSMAEARKVFGTQIAGTLRTIARDVKIQVEFDPAAVHSYRLLGYENRDIADQDFRDDAVDAGEVGSGHQVTAIYELVLADARPAQIATVRLRAKPPGKDAPAREWTVPVAQASVATFDEAGASTRLAVGVASFAELLRASPHLPEVTYGQVLQLVQRAIDPEREDHRELVELIERARTLSREAAASVAVSP
jgi:Ca-activated chloride channel family protein